MPSLCIAFNQVFFELALIKYSCILLHTLCESCLNDVALLYVRGRDRSSAGVFSAAAECSHFLSSPVPIVEDRLTGTSRGGHIFPAVKASQIIISQDN